MKTKEIKASARKPFKINYWRIVAVVFFVSIMTGTFNISAPKLQYNEIPVINSIKSDIPKNTWNKLKKTKFDFSSYKPTKGILANVFNNVTNSGNFFLGLVNSFNQLFLHERLWASLIIFIGTILTLIYWIFFKNVLFVGQARFFLENKNHSQTNVKRIFLPFKIKKLKQISFAMLRKTLYEYLWWLTIIGGIIKHYAYKFTPFILAENPGIDGKTALKLSEDMTENFKWALFKLDLSFFLWHIIDLFTFHLLSVIYIYPYKNCCLTEFYLKARENAKIKKIENNELLNDDYLLKISDVYPQEKFLYQEKIKKHLNIDYEKNYSISSLILIFFAASIFGWLWEVLFHLFRFGSFVNRGTIYGPWLPIYGWGTTILLILLKKYRKRPILTFILSLVICGIIEYGTAWYLEFFHNARWWDYDGYFLNIHGKICLEGLMAFGIAGCAVIYFGAPFIESILEKINKKFKIILCIILVSFFVIDNIYANKNPNTGIGVSQEIPKES